MSVYISLCRCIPLYILVMYYCFPVHISSRIFLRSIVHSCILSYISVYDNACQSILVYAYLCILVYLSECICIYIHIYICVYMVGLRAGQLHVVARDGCRLHLSESGEVFFHGAHFGFAGGCGDIHLGTSYICFCMDLTTVEACWVLTTCPNRSAKNQYLVTSRSHLRQDAEDVQCNDFISKLLAKIKGTPKHT